jgi:ribonuclease Z
MRFACLRSRRGRRGGLVSAGITVVAAVAGLLTAPPLVAGTANDGGSQAAAPQMVVTLLGTGTPSLDPTRFSQSTLVQANGLNLVFDAGRGTAIRLKQAGVSLGDIEGVFLTHFHSDHVVGLSDVWMTGYIPVPSVGGRTAPLQLYGPPGTKQIGDGLMDTFSADTRIRQADENVSPEAARIVSHEFDQDGVVFSHNGVKVTAFEVNHGDLIKPSYGYRVDYAGRSVLISGDTRFNQNVIEHGKGVDVLIHEVAAAPAALQNVPVFVPVLAHHTLPEEAGRVFAADRPKMAVYSHIVLIGTPDVPPISLDELVAETRTTYDGPLTVGADLTRFEIGDQVKVVPAPPPPPQPQPVVSPGS